MASRSSVFLLRLGTQIAHVRHERGMTQATLAERVGIKVRSVQRFESGRSAPSLDRLLAIAECLGVRPGTLIDAPAGVRKHPAMLSPAARDETRAEAMLRVWDRVPTTRRPLALKLLRALASDSSE